MIRVKRNTGFSGILSRIKIYINEKKVATVKANETIEVNLPSDEAIIHVTQTGTHSNELVVKNGQVIEITNSPWLWVEYLFIFISIFLVSAYFPHNDKIWGFILIFIIASVISHFKPGFELKVIYP